MGSTLNPYVDLHVHTWYSDSSMSPQAAVEEAVRNGVGVLAIADHEGFEGSREARKYCEAAGIRLISAAELECTEAGIQYHILCYGADAGNARLLALAKRSRRLLDEMSEKLLERMKPEYPALSLEEYAAFSCDRSQGGWKGLAYLAEKGVTDSLKAGMPLYARYGVDYAQAGFPALDDLLETIHLAGGKAVLAHAGHTLKGLSGAAFEERVRALLARGLDGAECYYPLHTRETTQCLLALVRARDLIVTAGSDCHGSFGHSRVGEMNIRLEQVNLPERL
ncbi:MAG: PHP domain-containing protein [Clostridia bacterium]